VEKKETRREFLWQSSVGGVVWAVGWPMGESAAWTPHLALPHARVNAGLTTTYWEQGFDHPPAEYRMGVYWWWFGPAQTQAEVARELAVMSRAGIGYVLIFPIYSMSPDDPAKGIRNYRYLSPEFLEVLGFAADKAKEFGIDVDVLVGTGWPYGGPSITPELGAQRLRVEITPIQGGSTSPPQLGQHEKLEAAWLVKSDGKRVDLTGARDMTESCKSSAEVVVPSGSGLNTLMVFFQSPTGMQVKRASLGAEGLVLDHLSRQAVETYIDAVAANMLPAVQGKVRALHTDSLEVFGEEWTPGFLEEFSQRRGYDLKPYLPALVADIGPLTGDVRHDFWRTLTELAFDHYFRPLHQWCHDHGFALQSESYGTPPVDLASYALADYPMGEAYDWKMFTFSRWASSAAHQLGRKVIPAEAWTGLERPRPRYVCTLQDIKVASDLHFVCGINKLVGHGYAYSPPAAGIPGWGYYAGVMMNDNNTWWPYFRLLADYVHRVSYALSLGKPMVDIALYLPEDDVMARQPVGHGLALDEATASRLTIEPHLPDFGLLNAYRTETPLIKTLLTSGFCFDGFDRSILQPDLRTDNGRLEVGDVAYRIAILPNLTGICLPILEKLAEFCHAGGVLVATRRLPTAAYGVRNRSDNNVRVRKLTAEIFGGETFRETHRNAYGKGTAVFVPDEEEGLAQLLASLKPQVASEPPDIDTAFLQRGEGRRQIYFVTNTSQQRKSFAPLFRDGAGKPRFWDPMTGNASDAPQFDGTDHGTRVLLDLDPFGSIIVAFDGSEARPAIASTNLASGSLTFDESKRIWTAQVQRSGKYFAVTHRGRREFNIEVPTSPLTVTGPWSFTTDSEDTPVSLESLKSWTEIPRYKFYSGPGTYQAEVNVPSEVVSADCGLWLDLGTIREIAEIEVNGNAAGVCWKLPYRVDITHWAKSGRNQIAITVTNLLINRVLGEPDPDFSRLPQPLRFPLPQEKKLIPEPLPSGLFGPVEIIVYRRVPLA